MPVKYCALLSDASTEAAVPEAARLSMSVRRLEYLLELVRVIHLEI